MRTDSIPPQIVTSVGRTFLYNPLMLFYAISPGLSRDKENKKSVANDIRDNEIANETMPRSISNEEEEGAR
jgi:hypothetical protein